MALLEVARLTVVRDGWPVVDGVTFAVDEDELVAVAGPRGSGKTTLLACLAGVIPGTSGVVSFDGRPVTRDDASRRVRRGMAWVPAGRASAMTVDRQLRLGAWSKGLRGPGASRRVRTVAEAFGGSLARRRRPVASLSRKDRVTIAIARAMTSDPRLLLVDAPTAGLEADDGEEVASTLRELARQGVAVVVAEHAGLLVSGANRVLVLDRGRIVAQGGSEEHHRLVASYLGASA